MINLTTVLLLLQTEPEPISAAQGAALTGFMVVYFAVIILIIAAMWKVFTKAGEPGWAAIVPIYNLIVLLKIAGKPLWWILLFFVPLVNFVIAFMITDAVAKRFGRGTGFGIGLALLPFIFYPILAWGDNRYQGAIPATA